LIKVALSVRPSEVENVEAVEVRMSLECGEWKKLNYINKVKSKFLFLQTPCRYLDKVGGYVSQQLHFMARPQVM